MMLWTLLLVGLLKLVFTIFTFGVRVPAGIFVPSLAIGACFGRITGILVQMAQESNPTASLFASCPKDGQCITPGIYAMVGAAGVLAGVTRMTISLVVVMFELTGASTYILPTMISVMVAKWVADAFNTEGIYDGFIRLNNYPFLDNKDDYALTTVAEQIMTPVHDMHVILAKSMHLGDLGMFSSSVFDAQKQCSRNRRRMDFRLFRTTRNCCCSDSLAAPKFDTF